MLLALLLVVPVRASDGCCAITKVRGNHRTIHTELEIDAPPDVVWSVLTDWQHLAEWSPTIRGMKGDISHGGAVVVDYVHPGNGKLLELDHTLIYTEGVQFGWSDRVLAKATDHHLFRVEPLPDGRTRFVQEDEVKGGVVVRLPGGTLSRLLFESYQEFNTALAERVASR